MMKSMPIGISAKMSLVVMAGCHAPEIRNPGAEDESQYKAEARQANHPVPLASLAAFKLFFLRVDDVALDDAFLSGPLEAAQINAEEGSNHKSPRDDERARGENHVDDDNVVIAVVVVVLDDSGYDSDDDVHGVVDGDFDSVGRPEDLLIPNAGSYAVDDGGWAEEIRDGVDAETGSGSAHRRPPGAQAHR